MPRTPRFELPDGLVHVTTRGNRRADIFLEERDYRRYLELCEEAFIQFDVTCHAFCLMPNHVHFAVHAEQEALSNAMHRLSGRYAQWFNRSYLLSGHVHQGRFHAFEVESNLHLLELARYIVLNPVRRGLCAAATDWPWSSYRATAGLAEPPKFLETGWLLGMFGRERASAQARYAAFVADGAALDTRQRPLPSAA
jgi:REP-associated tyrosine transposase